MSLHYSLVSCQNDKVLCEVTLSTGPYASVLQKILKEKNPINKKVMYQISSYLVHIYNDGLLTYLLVSDEDYSKILAHTYLLEMQKAFQAKTEKLVLKDVLPYGLQHTFGEIMKNQMLQYNLSKDNLTKLKDSLYVTQEVIVDNMEKITDRGQMVEILMQKAQQNSSFASRLLCRSRIKKSQARCSNIKMILIMSMIATIFATYVLLSISLGGPTLPNLSEAHTETQ
jgi:hypothetical protein